MMIDIDEVCGIAARVTENQAKIREKLPKTKSRQEDAFVLAEYTRIFIWEALTEYHKQLQRELSEKGIEI